MRRPHGILAGIGLLLPAAALAFVAFKAHDTASGAQRAPDVGQVPSGTVPVTPLLSVRRAPTSLAMSVRATNFATALSPVTEAVQDRACVAVAIDGTVVVADNAEAPFVPASNTKLLTAAVALDVLGPEYRFTTEARGVVDADGTVSRLVFVGGGDPLLSSAEYPSAGLGQYPPFNTTSLESLADAVVAAGVVSVTNLVADETRYDTIRDAPGWDDAIDEFNASRLSALMVDDGYTEFGNRVRNESTARGALEVFQGMLERRGVQVVLVAEGVAESEPVLASVQSVPLPGVIAELLTTSDNVTAELLLKEIGHAVTGVGSTSAGVSVISERIASWGVPIDGLALSDGSGLSVDNRVTCSTFVGVLGHVGSTGPIFDGLPIAGQTGTLAGYFEGTAADGVLRAKTGSLTIARSLSGYFPGDDGSMIEFSFLVNGEGAKNRAERLWDDLVAAFDSYPQGPSADQLAPSPPAAS